MRRKREIDFLLFVVPLTDEQKSQALVSPESCLAAGLLNQFSKVIYTHFGEFWSCTSISLNFMYVIIQVPMLTQILLYPAN